jgi:hypothetical protein
MLRVRLTLLLVMVLASVQSFSADKYWRPVDNSFHNPANWDPVGIPTAADRVIFDQFGSWDCVVYLDASVGGHLQYNNYTGIVSLQPGVNYTVGNTGFWMDSGGFYSNDEDLDINGSLEVHGGGFLSSTAITHVAGNLELNPWPLGGWFTDAGIIMIDGSAYTTLVSNINVKHLQMNKPFGYHMTIPAGIDLFVSEQFDFMDGVIQGPGKLQILKDCSIEAGSDGGTVPFWFTGNLTNHVIMDKNSHNCGGFYLAKSTNVDSVIVTSSIGELLFMHSTDSLVLQSGILDFQHSLVHLQQKVTQLQPLSTFLASEYTMYLERDWDNDGGMFKHRNGHIIVNGSNYSNFSFDTQEAFWNFELNKPFGYSLTLAGTDKLVIENKMTCTDGYLHGPTAWLSIVDSLHYKPTFDEGNAQLEFIGGQTNHFIIDHTTNLFNHVEINKTSPADSVIMETNLAHLQLGDNATDNIYINDGVLAFAKCGNHVDWNVKNLHIMPNGTFKSWMGTTYFANNLYENGGSFEHNNAVFIADGTTYSIYDVNDNIHFHNYSIAKPNGYSVTIAGTDSLIVENKYSSAYGYMQGPAARVLALDTAYIAPTHIKGTAHFVFAGPSDGYCIFDQNSQFFADVEINKDTPGTTVWFETNNPQLTIGSVSNENLNIVRGTADFQNVGTAVDWNWQHVNIQPDGVFNAHSGTTYVSGNMHELGGQFNHSNGVWVWDSNTYSTIDGLSEVQFFTMEMSKTSNYSLTINAGDSIRVFNKYTSTQGYLNGSTALLLVEDSTVIANTHIKGSAPIEFSGPGDAWLINNNATQFFTNTRIKKSSPGDTVWYESGSGDLTIGTTSENLYLEQGILAFQNYSTQVNWNTENTYIIGGTFRAPDMLLNWRHDVDFNSGAFDHNMGLVAFIGNSYSVISGTFAPTFYDVNWDKSSTFSTTILAPQQVKVENQTNYLDDYLNGGAVHANGDVLVGPDWIGGSSPLVFTGSADQEFDLTGAEDNFEAVIEINKPSGVVELQSSLVIEDNFAQLVLTNGLLTSANPSAFNPFFSNISTGWSGGNDDSYIACPALASGFGTSMVPVGDDGVFAPAGISNASVMATYRIAYHHSDPNIAFGASVTSPIDHIAQCEHWTVSVDTGTPTAKIHLSYDTDRCGAIDVPAELVVSAWNSGLSTWESTGQSSDNGVKIGGATVPNEWMAFTFGSTTTNNPMDGSTGDCAGDFNGDGFIDTTDLLSILGGFGCTGTCEHDLSGDGQVNTADLLQFLGLFGTVCV